MRGSSTTSYGNSFSALVVNQVWNKGRIINNFPPNQWRYDKCGNPMKYSDYGNTSSQYGWEIDHDVPVSKGGSDDIANLQPLQWGLNRKKGDAYPWSCQI